MSSATVTSPSSSSVPVTPSPSVLLRRRKRILFGLAFLLVALIIVLILFAYAGRIATNDDPWDIYIHVVRTIFLELLVVAVFSYIYYRLTSAYRSSPPKGRTLNRYVHICFILSLIVLYIPTFVIVIYPSGRWLPPSILHRLVDTESPTFVKVGFGTGVIMIQALFVILVIDSLYHIAKRIEKIWLDNCFRKAPIVSSSTPNSTPDGTKGISATVPAAKVIDPEIAVQTNTLELEKWANEQNSMTLSPNTPTDGMIDSVPKWVSLPFGLWKWLTIHLTPHPLPPFLAQLSIAIIIGFTIWGFISGSSHPRIMHVEIPLLRLPPSLDGFRIALLSDVHVGPVVGYRKLANAVDIANSINPDITVITGDFTDATDEIIYPMLAPAANLRSKYNRTYLVTGNHDYYEGSFEKKLRMLESLGITVLTNTVAQIPENATDSTQTFDLVGVPDWAESRKPGPWVSTNLPGTVHNRNVSRELVVLAHQPFHAVESGLAAAGLQLSGHVHCGQLIPVTIGAYVVMPYVKGLYERLIPSSDSSMVQSTLHATNTKYNQNNKEWTTYIYMTCGTYGFGPLFRQGAPHEITEVILRSVDIVGKDFKPIVEAR